MKPYVLDISDSLQEAYAKGYAQGIEDAAKVVENYRCEACNEPECQDNPLHYVEAIRALLGGGKDQTKP